MSLVPQEFLNVFNQFGGFKVPCYLCDGKLEGAVYQYNNVNDCGVKYLCDKCNAEFLSHAFVDGQKSLNQRMNKE